MRADRDDERTEALRDRLVQVAGDLYVQALKTLPPDVAAALRALDEKEPRTRQVCQTIVRNLEVAEQTDRIVCQDTGTPVYFARLGRAFPLHPIDVEAAIREGVARATAEHDLRSNVIHVLRRTGDGTNTGRGVPVVHMEFLADGDELELLALPKGSGSENQSFLKMLSPAAGLDGVRRFVLESIVEAGAKPCPPLVVGVGIGGTFDSCAGLAKRAVVRPVGSVNADPDAAALERDLLEAINRLGFGAMGLGGDVTALAVHVELADTHISQLPVAVNCQCWAARRRVARIAPNGETHMTWSLREDERDEQNGGQP